jgi:hypothetical protein
MKKKEGDAAGLLDVIRFLDGGGPIRRSSSVGSRLDD